MLVIKDPGARVDYMFDWGDAYLDDQTIVASDWAVEPEAAGGIAVVAASHDLLRCAATLEGGAAGGVYRVTNRVTLSDGQIDERSLTVRVEER
ncbi:hypothetical protein [Sphingopyxis sp. PET50]|uniref:phage fiber-tail adaptor protein n=1 Tax=Sphingopyxis sp. PET50 TaxID=2976533 RepID=UPI0021AF667C|nr:hypothetical protein [Sphingopyxis sp. PET50]